MITEPLRIEEAPDTYLVVTPRGPWVRVAAEQRGAETVVIVLTHDEAADFLAAWLSD